MSNLKILSMNCRGLADSQKRNYVFNFLRDKGYPIYCLRIPILPIMNIIA